MRRKTVAWPGISECYAWGYTDLHLHTSSRESGDFCAVFHRADVGVRNKGQMAPLVYVHKGDKSSEHCGGVPVETQVVLNRGDECPLAVDGESRFAASEGELSNLLDGLRIDLGFDRVWLRLPESPDRLLNSVALLTRPSQLQPDPFEVTHEIECACEIVPDE